MPEKQETGDGAFARFKALTKRVVSVPKAEIDRRSKEDREVRDAAKSEEAAE